MDLSTLLLALPIFLLAYQAIGMIFEVREHRKWGQEGESSSGLSTQKALRDFVEMSGQLGFNQALLEIKALRERLELLLLRSGHPFGWKPETLLLIKEILALLIVFLLWRLQQPLILWPVGLLLGFWLPDLYMKAKVSARQLSIQRQLSGFIDLLALTLESGLDLMTATERILEKMRPQPLREELATLLQENRLGTPRKETLQNLAYRVNISDMHSLTSMIIQSEELGTGLAGVLRNYADDMRSKRISRAEELAGKMPVKLLFPMMVFFFPIVFVIIFGPLALNFMSGVK